MALSNDFQDKRFDQYFQNATNLEFLEAYHSKDSPKPIYKTGRLQDIELHKWLAGLHQKGDVQERLVVLFSEGHAPPRNPNHAPQLSLPSPPLATTKQDFSTIASAFSIPSSYMNMLESGETVFIEAQPISEADDEKGRSLLMQNSFSMTSKFCASIHYNLSNQLTMAFVHGLKAQAIATLIGDIQKNIKNVALPGLIPTLLIRERVDSAVSKIKNSYDSVVQVEYNTGVKTNWHPANNCCTSLTMSAKRLDSINFDGVTSELTGVLVKMSYCEFVCDVYLPILERIDKVNNNYIYIHGSKEVAARLQAVDRRIRGQTEYLRGTLKGVQARSQYISKRAQALVQTMYSLISQRENELSMRENAELKKISASQGRVALAASRDSAAMKVIAAITTVFLPATFTAALFSTSFFNFQSQNSGPTVSWWLWLYFVVTICLSLVIFTVWYISSTRQRHKVDDLLGNEYDEKV